MPLFGKSGAPKLQLTRRMMIILAAFGVLLVAVIIVGIVLKVNEGRARTAPKVAAVPTTVAAADTTALPEGGVAEVRLSTQGVAEATPAGQVPPESAAGAPAAEATAIPAPTSPTGGEGSGSAGTGGGEVVGTTGTGGGEGAALPAGSSGLPYLIPVGAVLLLAVVWWRWRRAHSA